MDTNVIVIDRINAIAVGNGVVRIECLAASPSGQEKPSGTLLIPAVVAGPVIQSLVGAMQELDKKAREAAVAGGGGGFPSTIPTGNMTIK